MSWFKFYSLWRQPAPKNYSTTEKYLPYTWGGKFDRFPIEWDEAISQSPSASSCLSTVQDFIEGFGFSDPNLEKLVVNTKGQTVWDIHHLTTESFAEFEGFYWLLRYNALGQVTEWEFLPFENCRLGEPDSSGWISEIYYNPFFGTDAYNGSDKKMTICYDSYKKESVKAQIAEQKGKFKGQVFFYGTETARSRFYPLPKAHAVIDWMKIEAGVSDFHEERIDNGFLHDYILVMKGKPNDPSTNPEYTTSGTDQPTTVAQEFEEEMSKNFMGRGKHAHLMVQWVDTQAGEEAPEVVPIPTSANSDLFLTLDNQAIKKITVGWNVPAVLANIHEGVSLGGDGNLVRVAVKLMQQRVKKKQRRLTDCYSKVLKDFAKPYSQDITIVPYNPYPELEKIDPQVWASLSEPERRQWINDNTEIELIEQNTETEVETPQQPAAKIVNAIPVSFSDKIRNNAKKAIEFQDKMGLKCSGAGGRQVAQAIVDNQNMGIRQLKRIYNYLKKKKQYENSPFSEGCEPVLYQAWGGKEMLDFLEVKLKELDAWLN